MKRSDYQICLLDFLLVINALVILICPIIKITNLSRIIGFSLLFYGYICCIKGFILKNKADLENKYTAIAQGIFCLVIGFFDIFNTSKNIAYFLIIWILVMSIIKLIKGDYYHDRNNMLWITKVVSLIIFLITGVITCLNFYINNNVTIIVIGYFFLINYIIELLNQIYEIVRKIK